uniref:CSON010838 protein n=1 Tax=Culicoides sonorensis TaxID=179676 RepID=A0A336M2M9_CULSO
MIDPDNIKEWAPLNDLLSKIPVKSGLLKTFDQNLSCIEFLQEFIALGTDSGMVLWYNRTKKELQKLRTDSSSAVISCLEVVDSVDLMVACGDESGRLTIFQIEKEHPPDVRILLKQKPKPIERYTINGAHKHLIKSLAWSKNGMKLFSGDKAGVICLTEIDYQNHTSHSKEIINEFHEIVQIAVRESYLLCSTTFRTIICHKEQNDSWTVSQVGKKDRKTLCKLGATFLGTKQNRFLIATRPGYRFWLSDLQGNVTKTLILKDELIKKDYHTIPLINPSKYPMTWTPLNFGIVYPYGDERIVTCGDNVVYLINLKSLKIERVVDQLRGVLDIAVNFPEIFILETSRSVIRLSTEPEAFKSENEFKIDAGEECLVDLPPILPFIPDGVPKALEKSHEIVCKKLEQYRQIDTTNDDPILFESRSGRKKSKDRSRKSSTKNAPIKSDTDSSQIALQNEQKIDIKNEIESILSEQQESYKSYSTYMDVSVYNNLDVQIPVINKADRELKERELAKELEIEPVSLEPIDQMTAKSNSMTWSYPIPASSSHSIDTAHKFMTKKKRDNPYFVFDEMSASVSDDEKLMESNLSDDMKKVMISGPNKKSTKKPRELPLTKNSMSKSVYDKPSPSGVAILDISDYMKIPSLWNKMERVEDSDGVQDIDDSNDIANEWEIV